MAKMRTSKLSWKSSLLQWLKSRRQPDRPLQLAVVGIGQELCGDDGAGVAVVRRLGQLLEEGESVLLLEAGPAPENASGALRRFRPDRVLLVDTALFGGEVGDVAWLPVEELEGFSGSSHTLPLGILASYLSERLECPVALLGIQPGGNHFDTPISAAVERAAVEITAAIAAAVQGKEDRRLA
jgi:hydrogenase 3 maturation protease